MAKIEITEIIKYLEDRIKHHEEKMKDMNHSLVIYWCAKSKIDELKIMLKHFKGVDGQ